MGLVFVAEILNTAVEELESVGAQVPIGIRGQTPNIGVLFVE
jgi:hypothetical protein